MRTPLSARRVLNEFDVFKETEGYGLMYVFLKATFCCCTRNKLQVEVGRPLLVGGHGRNSQERQRSFELGS